MKIYVLAASLLLTLTAPFAHGWIQPTSSSENSYHNRVLETGLAALSPSTLYFYTHHKGMAATRTDKTTKHGFHADEEIRCLLNLTRSAYTILTPGQTTSSEFDKLTNTPFVLKIYLEKFLGPKPGKKRTYPKRYLTRHKKNKTLPKPRKHYGLNKRIKQPQSRGR